MNKDVYIKPLNRWEVFRVKPTYKPKVRVLSDHNFWTPEIITLQFVTIKFGMTTHQNCLVKQLTLNE